MSSPLPHVTTASRLVFSSRAYLGLGVITFLTFFALYAFVLPATYTGGRIGFVSLQFLTVKLGLFALLFSLLLSFIIPFAIYAFRKRASQRASFGASGFAGSILPPLLCCSPLLPSIAAFASGIFPFAFTISGLIQGFIATYETHIFVVLSLVLAYSLYQNAKQAEYAAQGVCTC